MKTAIAFSEQERNLSLKPTFGLLAALPRYARIPAMLRLTGLADNTAPAVLQEVSHGEKKLKLATDSEILWFCGPSFTDCPHFPFESFPYSENHLEKSKNLVTLSL